MSRRYQDEAAPLWLHIMGGILGAVIVVIISWQGYEKYQAYKAQQAIKQIQYEMQLSREREQQQRAAAQRMRIEEQQRRERVKRYSSPECKFWRNHYQNNVSEQNLKKVKEYCPASRGGMLRIE